MRTQCAHIDAWYAWAERAAILEFHYGWPRADAERQATLEIQETG